MKKSWKQHQQRQLQQNNQLSHYIKRQLRLSFFVTAASFAGERPHAPSDQEFETTKQFDGFGKFLLQEFDQ